MPITRRTLLAAALTTPVLPALANTAFATADGTRVQRISFRSATSSQPQALGQSSASHRSTGELDTIPFRIAALTWTGRAEVLATIRVRSRDGWTTPLVLHDDHHDPAPGSAEAASSRHGTAPVLMPISEGIEVEVEARPDIPPDLTIELIDPGSSSDRPSPDNVLPQADGRPAIRARADWGADESLRESGKPRYGEVRGAFVHHTAGANGYRKDEVPSIIRGIYAYHVTGRGWRDIGYNFVIDRFGRIWEGRYGGITKPVVGAHARGYNFYTSGAAVLGTYTNNDASAATLQAFAELIAWKFRIHNVDPTKVSYPGLKDVPAIAGHRDGGATACPGDRLYDQLSAIRGKVAALLD